jgi:hypothetical protein
MEDGMAERKSKTVMYHDVELEFTVKGDDQAAVLDIVTRLRGELGDVKFSSLEIDRRETTVYVD